MGEFRQVWVTRAQPGADATAGRLRARGHVPLIGSLLQVRRLPVAVMTQETPAALAFTSANAVGAFAARWPMRALPVFAVGAATEQAARRAGFADVVSADGDVTALAARIIQAAPVGLILHPCASEAAGDLAGALGKAGLRYTRLALYETLAVHAPPQGVADALAAEGQLAVLLHSPKAARALAGLLAAEPGLDASRLAVFGLSSACLAPLAHLLLAGCRAAGEPREAALLDLLG